MKRDSRAASAGAATGGGLSSSSEAQQQSKDRGYVVNRNEKLHLLARQKRTSASDNALVDRQPAAAGRSSSTIGRSSTFPNRPRAVRLSAVLQQAPQHFDRVKVAAVERMLTEVDELPEQFKSAEIVYLSKNCLTSLEGVQQFSRLRVLSAADNLLPDVGSLEVLTACPHLQVASFERNPLTGLPNYRQKVLQLLPNLENLDGQVVTPQELSRLHHVLQQEAACMAVMLSNACMVHKLARSAELLQLHTELRRTMFGTSSLARMTRGLLPSYIPLDLLKFLKLWDYEGSLSFEERRVICDALTREVVRVHKQLQQAAATLKGPAQLPVLQAWDTAFAKVMLAQQRTIIQLVELVNVLHGEAASLVSKLTGQQPVTPTELQHMQQQPQQLDQAGDEGCDRQLAADQQLVQERENLIIDLRDAALELAGLIATGETASDAVQRCSVALGDTADTCPSPQQLLQRQLQQQHVTQSPASSSARMKQQQLGLPQGKQGSSISLRRRSSASSHESLRIRSSPQPDKSSAAAAAAAAAARAGPSRIPPSPGGVRRTGSPAPSAAHAAAEAAAGSLSTRLTISTRRQQQAQGHYEQQLVQQQRQAGRYDGLSQSPSPEPSQQFGLGASLDRASHDLSPAASSSSRSPGRVQRPLSPTARRLLHNAQQQQQQWELDCLWQQQQQEQEHQYHHQQQQEEQEQYLGSPGVPLTEQPSEQWRALEQLGSAQHLLAALEHSPASSNAVRAAMAVPSSSSPRAGVASAAAAAAQPRPSLQNRAVGRSPGMVSPASSPESPVREEIGVYRKSLEPWGSRVPTRQPSSNSSWQAAQVPLPLQQQQQMDAAAAQLAAQESDLGRSNPVQSPAQGSPVCGSASTSVSARGAPAAEAAASIRASGRLAAASAPASPSRQVFSAPGLPAVLAPASVSHSAEAASIGSLVGPCRGAVSRTLQLQDQQVAAAAVADSARVAAAAVGFAGQQQGQTAGAAAAVGRPLVPQGAAGSPGGLRKSVSWADRQQQQEAEQQRQQQELGAVSSPAPRGYDAAGRPLFAEDLVPGACSMYSPYVPAMRAVQQPHAHADDAAAAEAAGQELLAAVAAECRPDSSAAALAGLSQLGYRASPLPSASPALSTAAEPAGASDAVGAMELSDLSGMSNASPSSVQFTGGLRGMNSPHSMNYNVLYSPYGEAPAGSDNSDEAPSGAQYSNTMSGMSGLSVAAGGAYETRDLSRPRVTSASRGPGPHGGSPGAQGEISFALQDGSPGSSPGESAAWLAAQGHHGQRGARGVVGLLGQLQQGQLPQQQVHHRQEQVVQERQQPQQQQEPQQQQGQQGLLWDLLHEDDHMQLESPSSGPSSSREAQAVVPNMQQPGGYTEAADAAPAPGPANGLRQPMTTGLQDMLPPAPVHMGSTGVGRAGAAFPAAGASRQVPAASAAAAATAAGASGRGQAGATYCDSSRGSFSSSMDLSPVKRQLFQSVSHSCHSLLQGAAGLSSIAAQLDAAAGAAAGHGSQEAAQAAKQALMAKQHRQELHIRIQPQQQQLQQRPLQGSYLQEQQQQLAGRPEHSSSSLQGPVTLHGQRVSINARKLLSSSAETASSWAASSITPYVNEATAAAEAALSAADAAAQLSTSCPATLMLRAYEQMRDSHSLPSETTTSATGEAQADAVAAAEAAAATHSAAAAQQQGVLLGLTPVVPGGLDRAGSAHAAAYSPAATDPGGSPRPSLPHGGDAVAKALFPAADAGVAAGQHRQPHPTESIASAAPAAQQHMARLNTTSEAAAATSAAKAQLPWGLSVDTQHRDRAQSAAAAAGAGSVPVSPAAAARPAARAAASSLPASPAPAAAAGALAASGPSSLPVSPARAAASPGAAGLLDLRSSRGSLGPRSTAALAELQSQLLTMAVEKATLQRQLQQGRSEVEKLQEKAGKSDQLEQVVYQMRSDLQQATQLLEHTGGAVHEQAALNQQLQEQMQQLQQQLWATEAERSRQAAADTLAKISLCRRVLRHFAAVAAETGQWRRLKQTAQQRGRSRVLRHVWSTWHASTQLGKSMRTLEQKRDQRKLAAVLSAWARVAWEQRVAAVQEAAAYAHWARSTSRRAIALWLFYTEQVRLLGVELPSPSTAPSSLRGSPEAPELPVSTPASTAKHGLMPSGSAGGWDAGGSSKAAAGHSRGAIRSLGPSFGLPARPSRESSREQHWQQPAGEHSEQEVSPERQPAKFAKSAKQMLSAGLVSLTERLSEALSPPKGARQESSAGGAWADSPSAAATGTTSQWPVHAGRRVTVLGFEQQQHDSAALRQERSGRWTSALMSPLRLGARSISVPGVDPSGTVGCSSSGAGAGHGSSGGHIAGAGRRPAAATAAVRRSGAAGGAMGQHRGSSGMGGADGGLGVPLALQASFMQVSRSQRLRRRWLLVKAFNRWCQLLQQQAAEDSRLAAAARIAGRRLQRRVWAAWVQSMQDKQHMHPSGLSHEVHLRLQQHMKGRHRQQMLRVLSTWRHSCREASMRRRTAQLLARQKRRHMQHLVLAALADHADRQHAKRCQQLKADKHRVGVLLQKAWFVWKDSIGLSHAAAAWQAQQSQQLLARAVCRWQQLSAALSAAAVAGATESRLAHLQRRRELAALRSAYTAWRLSALQSAADAAAQGAVNAQAELLQLQQQHLQDQQQLQQLPVLVQQQADLHQQLAAASTAKLEFEHMVERQQQQLQQDANKHQQQLAALQSEHQMGVTVLQEQLQQACTNADETMHQLQRLQQQHSQLLAEQQARKQQLEQQVLQQKQELEQQARQQLQRLDQQQQQWNQQQRQDQHLLEQLASRKAQCQELALQLKRCTEKLNTQTAAVQSVKAELTETQSQLAAARALSRNKSLTLTEKAVAAERGRSELEQQLAMQEASNRQLQQQLADVQRQLDQHRSCLEARRVAATAEQRADLLRLQEQLAQKDDIIAQLKDSMGAVQAQLASQQAKVVSEITQLRNNWSQAKAIIKQQRKTIKAQELQLQLLGTPSNWTDPQAGVLSQPPPQQQQQYRFQPAAVPQQQPVAGAGAGAGRMAAPITAETSNAVLKYPLTSWALQTQLQQVSQQQNAGTAHAFSTQPAAAAAAPVAGPSGSAAVASLGTAAAGPAGLQQGLHQAASAGQLGEQQQHSVLSRTNELLQCTDDILKSLRGRV